MAEIKVKHLDNEIQDKPDIELKYEEPETVKEINTNTKQIIITAGILFFIGLIGWIWIFNAITDTWMQDNINIIVNARKDSKNKEWQIGKLQRWIEANIVKANKSKEILKTKYKIEYK